MKSTAEIMNRGLRCLIDNLGNVEAEEFIAVIQRERFDYTKWRESLFEGMTLKEINDVAVEYAKAHPFKGKAKRI